MSRPRNSRRPQMRIGAVSFTTVDGDLSQAIALAGPHWLQRRWLADNRVTRRQRPGRRQTLRPKAANLFIAGENERQRFFELRQIDSLNRRQRGSDKSLCVTCAAAEEFSV